MGYITSATTEYLDLHMTERGRKYLLQGSLSDQIVKFALGDTDKDYRNALNLASGFVPDVTGNHSNCIFGVNDGYDIRDKITYIEGGTSLNKQYETSICRDRRHRVRPDTLPDRVGGSSLQEGLRIHRGRTEGLRRQLA